MLTASAASARTRRRNAASAPRSRTGQSRTERLTAAAMLAPSAVGVGLFLVAPIAVVVAVSLTDWNLITRPSFTGLENYASLLADSGFLSSLVVTALFSLMAIPATVAVGFLIALGLNRNLPGSSLMRLLYVLPWVCAPLTLGIVWKWLLDPSRGLIDGVLGQRVEWMSDPALALPTVAFVYVWQNVGYVSLFFLAGLQGIPASVIQTRRRGARPARLADVSAAPAPDDVLRARHLAHLLLPGLRSGLRPDGRQSRLPGRHDERRGGPDLFDGFRLGQRRRPRQRDGRRPARLRSRRDRRPAAVLRQTDGV